MYIKLNLINNYMEKTKEAVVRKSEEIASFCGEEWEEDKKLSGGTLHKFW